MTVIQQHSTAVVALNLAEDKGPRYIPFETSNAGQMLKTNLLGNLTFIAGENHIPGKIQQDCQIIQLPKITDHRGSLSCIEGERHIPFKIQSACWLQHLYGQVSQDGNAYRGQQEFIIAISGSIEVVVDYGYEKKRYCLNHPDFGLYVPPMLWRQTKELSTNAVVLILAAQPDEQEDCNLDGSRELEKLQ